MPLFGSSSENRIAALVDKLQEEGRLDQLEAELEPFRSNRKSKAEAESWNRFWGIAAFQRGDRKEALIRFEQGRSECPDSAEIAFSLGQEYEFVGDVTKMLQVFDSAMFPKVPAAYALAQSRYAYLWGKLDRALKYTLPLLDAYYELKIADDHFVYVRGLPFFGETWSHLAAFLELQGDLPQLEAITSEAKQNLTEYNFDFIVGLLSCIQTGDFTQHEADLREQMKEHENNNTPTGTQATKLAIIHAQNASTPNAALQALRDVKIASNDFPWLVDMLLLGECQVADRFALPNAQGLQNDFFARQALLFEPNHALNFRMLCYQETLKPRFQQSRKPG